MLDQYRRPNEQGQRMVSDDAIADFYAKKNMAFYQRWKDAQKKRVRFLTDDGDEIPLSTAMLNYEAYGDYRGNTTQAEVQQDPNLFQQANQDARDFKQNPQQGGLFGQVASTLLPAGLTRTGPSLPERIGDAVSKRGEELRTTMDAAKAGDKTNLQQGRDAFTTLTGGIGDVFGEVLHTASGVLPSFIEKGIALVAQDFKAPEAVQSITSEYTAWAEKHPEAAANLAAIGSLGRATANAYGVQALGSQTVKNAKGAAKATQEFMDEKLPPIQPSQPPVDRVQSLVQPKTTEKLIKDVGTKNPELVREGMLKTTLDPDQYQRQLATTAKEHIPGFGKSKNPVKNAKLVHTTIGNKSDDLLKSLQSNDAALPQKEITAAVNRKLADAAKEFDMTQPGIFDSTARTWKRISAKHPGTLSGQWKARIEFYKEVESRFGSSIFDKGTPRAEAVRAVGQAANETIELAAQRAGRSFKSEIDIISQLYDIKESLGTKFTASGPLKKALKSPVGRTAVGATVGGAAAGLGFSTFND